MRLHCWDLLGDTGCKDSGIHHLCIPEGDRGTTVFCGWRSERTSYLSLQNTQCLSLPGAPFRSHPALTGCLQLTGLGVSLTKGKRMSDPRRRWLGLETAASTGSKALVAQGKACIPFCQLLIPDPLSCARAGRPCGFWAGYSQHPALPLDVGVQGDLGLPVWGGIASAVYCSLLPQATSIQLWASQDQNPPTPGP